MQRTQGREFCVVMTLQVLQDLGVWVTIYGTVE